MQPGDWVVQRAICDIFLEEEYKRRFGLWVNHVYGYMIDVYNHAVTQPRNLTQQVYEQRVAIVIEDLEGKAPDREFGGYPYVIAELRDMNFAQTPQDAAPLTRTVFSKWAGVGWERHHLGQLFYTNATSKSRPFDDDRAEGVVRTVMPQVAARATGYLRRGIVSNTPRFTFLNSRLHWGVPATMPYSADTVDWEASERLAQTFRRILMILDGPLSYNRQPQREEPPPRPPPKKHRTGGNQS